MASFSIIRLMDGWMWCDEERTVLLEKNEVAYINLE